MDSSALHIVRPAGGGMRRHVGLLAKYLPDEGFEPHIAGPAILFENDEIPGRASEYVIPIQGGWGIGDIKAASAIAGLSKAIKPSLVHVHGYRSIWLGALAARHLKPSPMVATIHTLLPGSLGPAKRCILRWAIRQYDGIIAVSKAVRLDCLRLGVAWERIALIYNGVELREVGIDREAPAIPEGRAGEMILCAARLSPEKGVGVLLRALPLMEHGYLWVAGEGPERAEMERLAKRLKIENRVRFLGFRSDINALMRMADVVVIPSLMDGCPLVVWEAMAAGKAIVASAVGGIPEMMENRNTGLLIHANDPQALADSLDRMISDKESREAIGRRGQEWVLKERTARKMAGETASLYRQHLTAAQRI